jgi:hypothetical protein
VLRAQGRPEEAIPEYEAAIAFNRNWAAVSSHLGRCKFWTGSIEEGIALDEHAIRLKPTLMFRPCRGLLPRPPGPEWNLTWLRSKNFLLTDQREAGGGRGREIAGSCRAVCHRRRGRGPCLAGKIARSCLSPDSAAKSAALVMTHFSLESGSMGVGRGAGRLGRHHLPQ